MPILNGRKLLAQWQPLQLRPQPMLYAPYLPGLGFQKELSVTMAHHSSDVIWSAVRGMRSRGVATMSATQWRRGWGCDGFVRVTSSEVPCAVLRSGGVCHDVCHTVGEGVRLWRVCMSDVVWSAVRGVEIWRGLSRYLPHGGGWLSTSDVMRNAVQFHFGGIFLWTSSRRTGWKPLFTFHFSLTAFGEEVFFWVGNVERPIGERFDEEKFRNARVDFLPRYRKTQSRKRRARQPLSVKSTTDLQTDREFLKRSRAFRGEPCWQARERKSACSAQTSRRTCKKKPLGKRKALEFGTRTSLSKMFSGKQLGGAPVENPKRTSIVEAARELAGNCRNQAEQSNTKSSRQPETKRAGSHLWCSPIFTQPPMGY